MKTMRKLILFIGVVLLSVSTLVAQPKVVAHRGHWDVENGAHNSISSLYRAYETRVYGTEFDVWMTADGELVVFHDDKINGLPIAKTNYAELREQKISNGELLPTLDNFLIIAKNFPEMRLILEIKSNIAGEEYAKTLSEAVIEKVEAHNLAYRTDYIAFNLDICKHIAKIRPSANIAYLNGDVEPAELKEWGINGIDYSHSVMFKDLDMVKRAHDNGLSVNVWTVNDPSMMRKLIDAGVDYITTDKPVLLQQIIREFHNSKIKN